MFSKNKQSGYLLEIPLIMALVGILLAVFLPILPEIIGKLLLIFSVLVFIGGFYYMIVIPGWQPHDIARLHYPWSLLVFIGIATLLVLLTIIYVFEPNCPVCLIGTLFSCFEFVAIPLLLWLVWQM